MVEERDKVDNLTKDDEVQKNEKNNDEQMQQVQESDVKTSMDGYKNDKKVNISGSKVDISDNDVKQEIKNNNNIQNNNEQSNIQSEQSKVDKPKEETKIEKEDDYSKYAIYKVNGIIQEFTVWEECKSKSLDVAFETDATTMCYEAYTNSSGQKVYRIQLNY